MDTDVVKVKRVLSFRFAREVVQRYDTDYLSINIKHRKSMECFESRPKMRCREIFWTFLSVELASMI